MLMFIQKNHKSDKYYTLATDDGNISYAVLGQYLGPQLLTEFEQTFANYLVNETGIVMFDIKENDLDEVSTNLAKYSI
ncbi:hypothetical protein [Leuconostoc falkenbergense]|uniref:hypothetical protein n=1 Tax=Leuconostoc falkenbergense TaxID=2766470 RepID=UPI0039EA70B4